MSQTQTFTPKLFTLIKQGYTKAHLKADLIAGLTVAIVALPLAMALAIASGASPDKGLVTAVVAGFFISFLGGSRFQIGGPTGAFVIIVFNIIAKHGYDGLVLATLMAGIMLIIAGYAHFGQVIKFIPYPVLTGFTAGIGLTIASSQVKDFLGLQMIDVPVDFIPKWQAYFTALDTTSMASLIIGLGTLILILALRKYNPKIPCFLVGVALAALIVNIFQMPIDTIGSRFPQMPTGLPMPSFPDWNYEKITSVIPSAFTIAILAGIEALFSAAVADGMTGYKHRPNQELIGQGFANIASAFFAGLPATGAIARTASNIRAGGKTPIAGIFHALFLLIFMLFAMDIVAYIPMTALAAILFIVAWGMSEVRHFIHILKLSKTDRFIMLLTFFLTVLVDLTVAIGVGLTLACLLFMKHMTDTVKCECQKNTTFIDEKDDKNKIERAELDHNVEIFQITGPFFFGVASDLIDTLKAMGQLPKVLIIRMRLVPYLDSTGAHALEDLAQICHTEGTQLILSGLQIQPMCFLRKTLLTAYNHVTFCSDDESDITKAREIINK